MNTVFQTGFSRQCLKFAFTTLYRCKQFIGSRIRIIPGEVVAQCADNCIANHIQGFHSHRKVLPEFDHDQLVLVQANRVAD